MANIVVTGASRGLGLEFVKQLSKFSKTPTVFALCRNPDKAEKLQDVAHTCPNVKIVRADMIEFDQYQEVVSKIHANIQSGGVNLLINNAGMMLKDKLTSVTKENILDSFHLNSVAPVLFAKAAVNMVTKTLAMELKPSDIFVMALHPGWVKTDMGGKAAPLTPEQSVNGMLTVLAKAEESQRGCLFNNRGKRIPW
ncbi:C-factor-like isoform X2 [Uloborus diversus]|uniref:C-factor-like isoform X2 n=1 Tax=Uloborus diversus TaxID=327109 RepID=UPI00240A2EFB|nr:C-factor-like isoform X2 [Uloborus diversus]